MVIEHNLELPFHYEPRDYQKPFLRAMQMGIKRAVLVWHRRAGKEKTCWNYLITQALQRIGTYYYIFPDSKMARRILWDGMDKEGFKHLAHIPNELVHATNNTDMKISIRNGSKIQILGSHDVDSLRGPNPVGCVFSEYAEQSPLAWQTISPILRENEGWCIFNFTPKGQNHARDLYTMACYNRDWFAQLLTIKDTQAILEKEVDIERAEGLMSEDMIQQEYYCSFTLGIEGSYYAKYIQQAKDERRIGNVPHDKSLRVYTAWDIGYGDSTAIVFYQVAGKEIHVIDYYEAHGEGLPHYAALLDSKSYIYAGHFAPHDIEAHAFSSGLSAKEVGLDLGVKFITLPTLKLRLENGVEAVRSLFPRIWINQGPCKILIKCLENYRKEFDEKHNIYKLKPIHDWASHGADAFRYMALAVKIHVDAEKYSIGDFEADKMYDFYNPRFS